MELHQSAKILECRIAAAPVEVADKGRAPGGAENRVVAANHHRVIGVAGVLLELARGAALNDRPAHARVEAHTGALHIRPGLAEDFQDLLVVMKLHADVAKQAVGILLDEAEALLVEHVEGPKFALDKRLRGRGA